MVEEEV